MANYFVSSTGSNTGPYDTWAKAATTFATAVLVGTVNDDVIAVDVTNPPADIAADTTWTLVNNITVTGSTNSGTSTITPMAMGTTAWLGSSSAFTVTFTGTGNCRIYGITFRIGGTFNDSMVIGQGINSSFTFENCYFWLGTTSSTPTINIGTGSTNGGAFTRLINCTFHFGNTGQALACNSSAVFEGGSIASAGSAPATLFEVGANTSFVRCVGTDFSHITGTLVDAAADDSATKFTFDRCKFGSGMSVYGTNLSLFNERSTSVLVIDCASGDTHGLFGFYNSQGSVLSDTGIYFTAGVAAQSWKIITFGAVSITNVFRTPPISLYHTNTSAITPYLEILRDGSTTAYGNDEVWAEGEVKATSGAPIASLFSDAMAFLGTPAAQANGAGLGSWTGEGGTAWSGKIDSGSAVTPAEVGEISMNICVALASNTFYVDPQIRI